jgi:hypothetical protein
MYCGPTTFVDGWGSSWADSTATQLARPVTTYPPITDPVLNAPAELMAIYRTECAYPTIDVHIPGAPSSTCCWLASERF